MGHVTGSLLSDNSKISLALADIKNISLPEFLTLTKLCVESVTNSLGNVGTSSVKLEVWGCRRHVEGGPE